MLLTRRCPVAVLVVMLMTVSSATAITINSATVSLKQVTITGVGFTGTTAVTLGGQKLTVVSATSTQIVATMSSLPPSGSYRLVVKVGTASSFAYVQVPAVVAQVALQNQTGAIPPTNLLTVSKSGLFRISLYETGQCNNTYPFATQFQWNDDMGQHVEMFPINSFDDGVVGNTVLVRVNGGSSVSYSVPASQVNCTPYELYMTVEQLQ